MRERYYFEDLGIDGRIILNWSSIKGMERHGLD
jgi:hypothetical protein